MCKSQDETMIARIDDGSMSDLLQRWDFHDVKKLHDELSKDKLVKEILDFDPKVIVSAINSLGWRHGIFLDLEPQKKNQEDGDA